MRKIKPWLRQLALRALGIDLVIENLRPLPELFVEMREAQELAADEADRVVAALGLVSKDREKIVRVCSALVDFTGIYRPNIPAGSLPTFVPEFVRDLASLKGESDDWLLRGTYRVGSSKTRSRTSCQTSSSPG